MPNPVPTTPTGPAPPGAPRTQMSVWLERETRLAFATRPLRAQLADPDAFTDRRGHRHAIAEMSADEAHVVMRLLRRRARALHRGAVAEYLLAPYPNPTHPQPVVDAAHQQLVDTDPQVWINQTPLMRAPPTARAPDDHPNEED